MLATWRRGGADRAAPPRRGYSGSESTLWRTRPLNSQSTSSIQPRPTESVVAAHRLRRRLIEGFRPESPSGSVSGRRVPGPQSAAGYGRMTGLGTGWPACQSRGSRHQLPSHWPAALKMIGQQGGKRSSPPLNLIGDFGADGPQFPRFLRA